MDKTSALKQALEGKKIRHPSYYGGFYTYYNNADGCFYTEHCINKSQYGKAAGEFWNQEMDGWELYQEPKKEEIPILSKEGHDVSNFFKEIEPSDIKTIDIPEEEEGIGEKKKTMTFYRGYHYDKKAHRLHVTDWFESKEYVELDEPYQFIPGMTETKEVEMPE